MSKIVVVGANHAGTAAINTIIDNYEGNEVVAFEANSNISFLGCGMALWIGGQISKPDGLFYQTREEFEAKGVSFHTECGVDRIDYDAKKVYGTDKDGNEVVEDYDKLILATGSLPIIPRFEGGDLENIQQVKLFQNAVDVVEKLKDPAIQRVAVVGAGYIGVELAEAFQRHGRQVTLIDMAPTCMSTNFDPEFSELMAKNMADNGIDLRFGEGVQRFEGENGKVTKLVTDKNSYDVDMVCVCIGFRPNTSLVEGAGIETLPNGAILVDHTQKTTRDDVYAVGDCASIFNNSDSGKPGYIALATNAVRSGIIAGHNICGTTVEGPGVQGSSAICIFGYKMAATGQSAVAAERNGYDVAVSDYVGIQKAAFVEEENPEVKIRLVYDKTTRKLLGAQMASTYDMSAGIHMYSLAIQEGLTVDKLALLDIFFLPHFNEPYNYYTMAAYQAMLADK
ncbi:MAG: FAD-dependent oxidoreductase [Atopobiaceae bacterium]|nr:FAD-dependent oxidoreductase [Atopobiaceae bacterium]